MISLFIKNTLPRHLEYSVILLILFSFFMLCCLPQISASAPDSVKIVSVSKCKPGETLPVFVTFVNEDGTNNRHITGKYNILTSGNSFSIDTIFSKYGTGSILTTVMSNESFEINIEGLQGKKQIEVIDAIPQIVLSGNISENTVLTNNYDYLFEDDITINANVNLSIESGTRIFLGENVNVFVYGILSINGSESDPVIFTAADQSKAWGGINILNSNEGDTTIISHTFLLRAGGDIDFIFGHSNSQAVIKCANSNAIVSNCYLMDNKGKCFGSTMSNVKIIDSYLTRSDTGGEFMQSIVFAKNVYVADIPDGDHIIEDDDNDGFYFNAAHPTGVKSTVDSCIFVTGEDDAIDQNGAKLEVKNCVIDDFNHEGIAASNSNNVFVFNSIIKNCEQGIEAGYGSPTVNVEHCVVIENDTGIRFGDSYNWGCTGKINIINSIIYNNYDNFRNFDLLTESPVIDAIIASYCITNDVEYDNSPFCITGVPIFDSNYFLANNSPGRGMASTGLDMGLLNPFSMLEENVFKNSCLNIYPNPGINIINIHYYSKNSAQIKVIFTDISGSQIAELHNVYPTIGNNLIQYNVESFASGLYFVSLYSENVLLKTLKIIVE